MGGSKNRMKSFAAYFAGRMGLSEEDRDKMDVSRTDRYSVFKVGPVLALSVSVCQRMWVCVVCESVRV